jgi:hypothetical protein
MCAIQGFPLLFQEGVGGGKKKFPVQWIRS